MLYPGYFDILPLARQPRLHVRRLPTWYCASRAAGHMVSGDSHKPGRTIMSLIWASVPYTVCQHTCVCDTTNALVVPETSSPKPTQCSSTTASPVNGITRTPQWQPNQPNPALLQARPTGGTTQRLNVTQYTAALPPSPSCHRPFHDGTITTMGYHPRTRPPYTAASAARSASSRAHSIPNRMDTQGTVPYQTTTRGSPKRRYNNTTSQYRRPQSGQH